MRGTVEIDRGVEGRDKGYKERRKLWGRGQRGIKGEKEMKGEVRGEVNGNGGDKRGGRGKKGQRGRKERRKEGRKEGREEVNQGGRRETRGRRGYLVPMGVEEGAIPPDRGLLAPSACPKNTPAPPG